MGARELIEAESKPRPTFKEMQAVFAVRRQHVQQTAERLQGRRSVRFRASDGSVGDIIVTPSASESGKWQLTWFTKTGEPWGHAVYPNFEEVVSSAMGQFTKSNGPPHGSSRYEPVG